MDISKQVCTLEQAKRLKELGVAQGKSAFAFIKNKCHDEIKFRLRMVLMEGVSYEGYEDWEGGCLQGYSAFTVAELGEILPTAYDTMRLHGENGEELWFGYDDNSDWCLDGKGCKTEAEMRAAMLIHLIESKLITIEQINK